VAGSISAFDECHVIILRSIASPPW